MVLAGSYSFCLFARDSSTRSDLITTSSERNCIGDRRPVGKGAIVVHAHRPG